MCDSHKELRVHSLEVVHGDIHSRLPFQRPHKDEELMVPVPQALETQQLRCCTIRVSLIQRHVYVLPVEL